MLRADQERPGGERLTNNRQVAEKLTELLERWLTIKSPEKLGFDKEELLKQQEFLARTLGYLDVDDCVAGHTCVRGICETNCDVVQGACGAGFTWPIKKTGAGYVRYQGTEGDDTDTHALAGGVSFRF